ncbi:hypothetical protein GCM10010503_55980 [Streptomyces lucensis JCM 4490]|uniref:Uncharacterized protein n=1 Tax=Streptomyces lucensis JCM 4490 TaxID=1306176 RepID=A0A918JBF3_9ACTN|nr:hypothetical protein GCM10010503_55980 [Streptomyces lucensis JCM 4490]
MPRDTAGLRGAYRAAGNAAEPTAETMREAVSAPGERRALREPLAVRGA